MKNLKKFQDHVNEWHDAPGSIDVPSNSYENKVRARNYQSNDPSMPQVYDAMYEAAYFHEFLDGEGKSEELQYLARTTVKISRVEYEEKISYYKSLVDKLKKEKGIE